MHRLRPSHVAAGLALTLLSAGCDGGADETRESARRLAPEPAALEGGPATRDAAPSTGAGCALLTEEEVEEALGFGVVMNDNTTGNCLVTPDDGSPSGPAVDFRIEDRATAYDYFAAQPDAEPIPDLGDRAVWSTLNEMTGNVVAVVGGRAVVVAIARADGLDERARQQAVALAHEIVERL